VSVLGFLIRAFSFLYHMVLALFLIGLALMAWSSHQELHLDMMPWRGSVLTYALLVLAPLGLLFIVLALFRKLRGLFFLWSLAVLAIMFWGFFLSPYHFAGPAAFHDAILLTIGALFGVWGAWLQLRSERRRYL
jgi:hypothetical protein